MSKHIKVDLLAEIGAGTVGNKSYFKVKAILRLAGKVHF